MKVDFKKSVAFQDLLAFLWFGRRWKYQCYINIDPA